MKLLRLLNSGGARLSAFAASIKAPQWVSVTLIAITLLCAAVFLWLLFQTALDKDTELWGKAFVCLIGLLTAAASVAVSWEPDATPLLQRLATLRGAGLVLMAVFATFGPMTEALSLFEPRAATTDDTDAIKSDTDAIKIILRARFPEDPPILTGIVGRWGEQDTCALVWDIAIIKQGEDAALVAEIVKRPDGVEPFRLLAEITEAKGETLDIVGEEPVRARGRGAAFTLNSATQRLVWDDKSSAGGVEEYVRCP
jgi:hypothetical protein